MWGDLGDAVISPLFLQQTLNGEVYLELLQNMAKPLIVQKVMNQQDVDRNMNLRENLIRF